MFDNHLPKARRVFRFGDISVAVRLVDDDPGAVQVHRGTHINTAERHLTGRDRMKVARHMQFRAI